MAQTGSLCYPFYCPLCSIIGYQSAPIISKFTIFVNRVGPILCTNAETPYYLVAAENPAVLMTSASSSTLTLFFRTLITALSGKETSALITFSCFVSASCTFATQAGHVIPVTVKATSSLAVVSIGTDMKMFNCLPELASNIRIFPSKPPVASCVPSG